MVQEVEKEATQRRERVKEKKEGVESEGILSEGVMRGVWGRGGERVCMVGVKDVSVGGGERMCVVGLERGVWSEGVERCVDWTRWRVVCGRGRDRGGGERKCVEGVEKRVWTGEVYELEGVERRGLSGMVGVQPWLPQYYYIKLGRWGSQNFPSRLLSLQYMT